MKGYKWTQRTEAPDMPPLDPSKMDDTATLALIEKVLDDFIKEYKSAVRRKNTHIDRGASVEFCRATLETELFQSILAMAGTDRLAVINEIEGGINARD